MRFHEGITPKRNDNITVIKVDDGWPVPKAGDMWTIKPKLGIEKLVEVVEIKNVIELHGYRIVQFAYRERARALAKGKRDEE